MFQLLVLSRGWKIRQDTMSVDRTLSTKEYTDEAIVKQLCPDNVLDVQNIKSIPALFASELRGAGSQFARVGTILDVSKSSGGANYTIEYAMDENIPPIDNARLAGELAASLDIESGELHRTHWAAKNADLFAALLRSLPPPLHAPKVFSLSSTIDDKQVAVMMPFKDEFSGVYDAIRQCAETLDLRCNRADDIWHNHAVIQDIASLISRARVVVCDCSGQNANVFYEAGIAHALGRDVILITQSAQDVPFNLNHLRYVTYLNNAEGLQELATAVRERIQTILPAR